MNRLLMLLLCIALYATSHCQTFKSAKDVLTNTSTVQYYNQDAQIVIQKVIYAESPKPIYFIGLIIYRNSVSSDEFMKVGAGVVFEDDSKIIFQEQPSLNYLYSGKHQLSIKHQLTDEEFNQLKAKTIKYFRVASYLKEVDRFEKEKVKGAFIKVETE